MWICLDGWGEKGIRSCKSTVESHPRTNTDAFSKWCREFVEGIVRKEVEKVIKHPKVMMKQLERRVQKQRNGNGPKLAKAIAKLKRCIDRYNNREKRFIKLLGHGEITQEFLLDELNQLMVERERDTKKLAQLEQQQGDDIDILSTQQQLDAFCERIQKNLNGCGLQKKRMALDVRVMATPKKVDIRLAAPLEFITIEQTSECLASRAKKTFRSCHLKSRAKIIRKA